MTEVPRTLSRKALAWGSVVLVLGLSAATAIVLSGGPSGAGAADHLDAPGLTPPGGDVRLDLTDIYAFRSRPGRTVLVMNVNGFTKPGKQARFATGVPNVRSTKRVSYNFRIDNNGDAEPDVVLSARFGKPTRRGVQKLKLRRNGRLLVSGRTSRFGRVKVYKNRRKRVRVFAGMRDDPFFFDLDGFLDILSKDPGKSFIGCKSKRKDKFAGTNVSSIVVELKSSLLRRRGGTIGVEATTNKGRSQVDRMGRPAIATVFIPNNPFEAKGSEPSLKNTYNHGKPSSDQARFRGEVVDSLQTLFSLNDSSGDDTSDDAAKISGLADTLLPDLLTYDTRSSKGFLNGRRLRNDVIDAELNLITEGAVTTDCVDRNDRSFRRTFPYLARPHR